MESTSFRGRYRLRMSLALAAAGAAWMIPTKTAWAQGSPPQFGQPRLWNTRFANQEPQNGRPCGLAVADVMGPNMGDGPDRWPDILVANDSVSDPLGGSIAVFASQAGQYDPVEFVLCHVIKAELPEPPLPGLYAVEAGDLDNDGDLDIVALASGYDDATLGDRTKYVVVWNLGNGNFGQPILRDVLSKCDWSIGLETANFNPPSVTDFALTVYGEVYSPPPEQPGEGPQVEVYFTPFPSVPPGPQWYAPDYDLYPDFGSEPSDLVASVFRPDFDRPPPLIDLITPFQDSDDLFYLLNTGAGTFEIDEALSHQPDEAWPTKGMAAGWFRPGNIRDLVLSGEHPQTSYPTVFVLKNEGNGWFVRHRWLPMADPNYGEAVGVATGNLNDDNIADIAMVYTWGLEDPRGGVAIWRGMSGADPPEFLEGPEEPRLFYVDPDPPPLTQPDPQYVRVADLDRDGRRDLAVTCRGTGRLSVRLNTLTSGGGE